MELSLISYNYLALSSFFSCGSESSVLRVEALPEEWFEYNNAFATITDFYGKTSTSAIDARGSVEIQDTQRAEGKAEASVGINSW